MSNVSLKRKLYFMLEKRQEFAWLRETLRFTNSAIFHWKERSRLIHPGKGDPQNTYYVIRPLSKDEGLMSTYFYVAMNVLWAREKKYIPYVDFSEDNCQYHVQREINHTNNAWEYYFMQPTQLGIEEIRDKKNVLLSGWSYGKSKKMKRIDKTPAGMRSIPVREFCHETCPIQPYLWAQAETYYNEKMKGSSVLGIFIRGTDYVKLEPKGHYRQPTVTMVMEKVSAYLAKYAIDSIYLVTEDFNIYQKFDKKYPGMVFSSDNNFVKDYDESNYIANAFKDDPYERGKNYLIRLMLLTKCDYLISSLATGSLFTLAIKEGEYKACHLFDIGKY